MSAGAGFPIRNRSLVAHEVLFLGLSCADRNASNPTGTNVRNEPHTDTSKRRQTLCSLPRARRKHKDRPRSLDEKATGVSRDTVATNQGMAEEMEQTPDNFRRQLGRSRKRGWSESEILTYEHTQKKNSRLPERPGWEDVVPLWMPTPSRTPPNQLVQPKVRRFLHVENRHRDNPTAPEGPGQGYLRDMRDRC